MKTLHLIALVLFPVLTVFAKEHVNLAEDDAGSYTDGWKPEGAGTGFSQWTFQDSHGEGESHAGRFLAESSNTPDLGAVAPKGKAFGLYANGVGFEAAVAFRSFNKPLEAGQAFSFLMKNGPIEKKFENDDPGTGAIGLTLRSGNTTGATDDYNHGARFEFGYYEGQTHYQIYDVGENHDTGVSLSPAGVAVTLILTGADTYDLEITNLGDKNTTKLSGRKLGGSGGLESFCIFNRDGEKSDGYFNGFQVSKEASE